MEEALSGFYKGMQNDIFDSLDDLGYSGPLRDLDTFQKALSDGPQSPDFTTFIEWITTQLNNSTGTEEYVRATADLAEVETFLMELSGFLREYGCPYKNLCEGPLLQRLATTESKLLLLDYLLSELQAARIITVKRPQKREMAGRTGKQMEAPEMLQELVVDLGLCNSDDDDDDHPKNYCAKLGEYISNCLSKVPAGYMGKPLLTVTPKQDDWAEIEYINQALKQDYACRRQMLIQRLDVTMQSFRWSEKLQRKEDKLNSLYRSIRNQMCPDAEINMSHLLAARDDLLHVEKTSGGKTRERTKCIVNQVLMGKVPDRGGRAYEFDVPSAEMPAFQKRKPQQGGSGGHRGHGGHRGGYHGGHRGGHGGHGGGHGGDGGDWSHDHQDGRRHSNKRCR